MASQSVFRRQILGAVALSATAGCSALGSESGIQVGNIQIGNWRDEPVTITVRLDRAGETVVEEALELDGGGNTLIEQSWNADPAEYTLLYSTEGEGRIYSVSLPEDMNDVDGTCSDIQIHCRQSLTDIVFRDDSPPWGQC